MIRPCPSVSFMEKSSLLSRQLLASAPVTSSFFSAMADAALTTLSFFSARAALSASDCSVNSAPFAHGLCYRARHRKPASDSVAYFPYAFRKTVHSPDPFIEPGYGSGSHGRSAIIPAEQAMSSTVPAVTGRRLIPKVTNRLE